MTDINEAMMQPMFLAGLGVIEGKTLSDALTQAAASSLKFKQAKQAQADRERQEQLAAELPNLLSNLDVSNPNEAISSLVAGGVSFKNAANAVNQQIDNVRQARSQRIRQEVFDTLPQGGENISDGGSVSTSGGDMRSRQMAANQKIQAGARLEDRSLIEAGKAELEQIDRERKVKKESFSAAKDIMTSYKGDVEPIKVAVSTINNAYKLAKDGTGASDFQLAKMAIQINDRRASAVTDGEMNAMEKTGGMEARFGNLFSGWTRGTKFTPKQRKELLKSMKPVQQQAKRDLQGLQEGYGKLSANYGVDFDTIKNTFRVEDITDNLAGVDNGIAPPPAAIEFLRNSQNDPSVVAQFEQKYGEGSVSKILTGN